MKTLKVLSVLLICFFAYACGGGGDGGGDPLAGMEGNGWNEFPDFSAGTPLGADESDPAMHTYGFSGVTKSDITSAESDLTSAGFVLVNDRTNTNDKVERIYLKIVGNTDYIVDIQWGVDSPGTLMLKIEIVVNEQRGGDPQAPTSITVTPTTVQVNVQQTYTFTYTPTGSESSCTDIGIAGGGVSLNGSVNAGASSATVKFTTTGTKTVTQICGGVDFPMSITVN